MRVLVIDDDGVARELMASTLVSAGHVVSELPSAIGATREIYRHCVDVVVIDVVMPDISGDKLARLLRGHSRGKELGIVLVSSRSEAELDALALAAEADGVLTKSQISQKLNTVVSRAWERRSRQAKAGAASGRKSS